MGVPKKFSAAEAARSLECLNQCLGLDGPLLTVPPGWEPPRKVASSFDGSGSVTAAAAIAREGRLEQLSSTSSDADGALAESEAEGDDTGGDGGPTEEGLREEEEEEQEEEKRVDPSDGNHYNLAEFYQAYGPENGAWRINRPLVTMHD